MFCVIRSKHRTIDSMKFTQHLRYRRRPAPGSMTKSERPSKKKRISWNALRTFIASNPKMPAASNRSRSNCEHSRSHETTARPNCKGAAKKNNNLTRQSRHYELSKPNSCNESQTPKPNCGSKNKRDISRRRALLSFLRKNG